MENWNCLLQDRAALFRKGSVIKMHPYERKMLEDTEKGYRAFCIHRCEDPESVYYGGTLSEEDKLCTPKSTLTQAGELIALYLHPQSAYYRNKELYRRLEEAFVCLERLQREDGTFDNPMANFYAAANTAFLINRFLPSYRLAKKDSSPEMKLILQKADGIFYKAAGGIACGGFHTPNHRWAIAGALMALYNLYGVEEWKNTAQKYLKEGIDLDSDGDFAEHSSGKYNVVNDLQMLVLYEETGEDCYLSYMEANLDMMRYYLEPDGSIFTATSTRLDAALHAYPDEYFFLYLYVGCKRRRKDFLAQAQSIMEGMIRRGAACPMPNCLAYFMDCPELLEYTTSQPEEVFLTKPFTKYFSHSGVLRIRRAGYTATLLEKNSFFLRFQHGRMAAFVRLGASYFKHREFRTSHIEEENGSFRMESTAHGWFYLPFDKDAGTTDWWQMDHSLRKQLEGRDLRFVLTVTPDDRGIDLHISVQGCDRVPIKVEFALPQKAFLCNESFWLKGGEAQAVTVRNGSVTATIGEDGVRIGPAFASHLFTEGNDKSEPRDPHFTTLYFTDYTPVDRTVRIEALTEDIL